MRTALSTILRRSVYRLTLLGLVCLLALFPAPSPHAKAETFITLASTTSTENSGLYDHLLPLFQAETKITVRVVAVGTGQALRLGERGDADVVLVHDTESEKAFVAAGYGVERFDVMYNDYVLVGPGNDPAGIKALGDVTEALARIAERRVTFVSRGDDSGTHKAERRLWKETGVDIEGGSGSWYLSAGAGMGQTLNTAAAMDAYTISDRGTWLSFQNRRNLVLLVENEPRLFNQYGVILVNPARHAHIKKKEGQIFIDWILSAKGQAAIADFRLNGEPLFFPNAAP